MNYLLLSVILSIAVWSDVRTAKISNRLILAGLATGLSFRIWGSGWTGFIMFVVNISIPVILLYLLFLMRAIGAGDIKLFSVAGGLLGTKECLTLIVSAFVVGALLSFGKIIWLAAQKKWCFGEKHFIHFSIAILVGFFVCLGVDI